LLGKREEVSPDGREIGVWQGYLGRAGQKQGRRRGERDAPPEYHARKKESRDGSTQVEPSRRGEEDDR
jgi:hypothetical protein